MDKLAFDRVDTHCHLWEIDLAKRWMTPEWPGMFRTFRPDDVSAVSKPLGVTSAIAIECGLSDEENKTLRQVVAESDYIRGYAPYVDLEAPDLEHKLKAWNSDPKCVGVRMRFEGHPDQAILRRPSILEGLMQVAEHGLIFEYLVRSHHLLDVVRLQERVPALKAIIEHMAKPDFAGQSDCRTWEVGMEAIAKHTDVSCKLSLSPQGERVPDLLCNFRPGWPVDAIKPFANFVVDHFGTNRVMWGSDYPIALLTSDYAGTLGALEQVLGPIDATLQVQLFQKNAIDFYGV
jgi:L-fuconolactonase